MTSVAVIGTGASVQDHLYVARRATIAVAINDAHRLTPWASFLYAADGSWWEYHKGAIGFRGARLTQSRGSNQAARARRWGVRVLQAIDKEGLSDDPASVHLGMHSGYQAVNVAYHLMPRRVELIGMDYNGTHFFGFHPDPLRKDTPWASFKRKMREAVAFMQARGIEVIWYAEPP